MSSQSRDVDIRLDHLCASLYPFVTFYDIENTGIYGDRKRNTLMKLLESIVNVCALLPSCDTASIAGTIDDDQNVHLYICASGSPAVQEEVTRHLEGWADRLKALKSDAVKDELEGPEHQKQVRDLVLSMYRPCWRKVRARSEAHLDPLEWSLYHQDLRSHLKRYTELAPYDDLGDEDFLALHDVCTDMMRSMKEHPSEYNTVVNAVDTFCMVTRAINAFVHAALSPSNNQKHKLLDSLRNIQWIQVPTPRRFSAKLTPDNLKSLLGSVHSALQNNDFEWIKVVDEVILHEDRDPPFGHRQPDGTVTIDEDITAHCEAVLMQHFAEALGICSPTYFAAAGRSCYGCMQYAVALNMTYKTHFIARPILEHPMAGVWVCPPQTGEEVKKKLEQLFAEHLSLLYKSSLEDGW